MPAVRILSKIFHSVNQKCKYQYRTISSTAQLQGSWMDKVKNVIAGQKSTAQSQVDTSQVTSDSFTLLRFADEMKNARRIGAFKEFMVGRSSEVTFSTAFEKYEAIIRYLGGLDPTGENLQTAQKQEAAKHCNCTIADVENALSKFTWAKEAQKKIEKLKEEGKPMPKSFAEVQKLVGSTPLDLARSNLAQAGQISRNALCPCGSMKRYKRCCGKD
ncbi:translocase subunit SecA 1 [Spatholobus suberectus]|nr:translocase subunit SecA 1 [Spatholobus suberectus]